MLTGFPLTNMGIFYPDLFPGFQEYVNVATPVVSDVSEVTVSFYKNKDYIHRHMDAKSKSKALIYETRALDQMLPCTKATKNDMCSHK